MEEELLDTIENKVIMKDIDYYKDEIHCLYDEKKELQERIDKAIEYIEEFDELVGYNNEGDDFSNIEKKLLDILKGEEKL